MTVAVTGANGFIGSRFIEMLRMGYPDVQVRQLARRRQKASHHRIDSLADPQAVSEALAGCNVLVHCAFDFQNMPANLAIAQVIAHACIKAGIRLIHVSTAAVYEPLPDGPLDENASTSKPGSQYKMVKARIEAELVQLATTAGLDLIILQPTTVYGPNGRAWTDSPIRELLTGTVLLPDNGEGLCNAVYVDDVCQAMIASLTAHPPSGSRILVNGPQPVTWKAFYGAYQNMLQLDAVDFINRPGLSYSAPTEIDTAIKADRSSRLQFAKRKIMALIGARNAMKLTLLAGVVKASLKPRQLHTPSGAKLALFQSRCHIQTGKARALLGYEPKFDLSRGMSMTSPYVTNLYGFLAKMRRRRLGVSGPWQATAEQSTPSK